ncbi:MAG: hypothetical protein RLZZ111_122, partial [Planctomycetota bacterium]
MNVRWLPACLLACAVTAARAEPPTAVAEPRAAVAEPPETVARMRKSQPVQVTASEIHAAVARGRGFLVAAQNRDGSFGSAERTKNLNIMAGVGSHFG